MMAAQIVRVADPFRLVRNSHVYRVIADRNGATVRETLSLSTAQFALDRAAWQNALNAVQKERPCMCCSTLFRSEGPHNRLCNYCRQKTGGMD